MNKVELLLGSAKNVCLMWYVITKKEMSVILNHSNTINRKNPMIYLSLTEHRASSHSEDN